MKRSKKPRILLVGPFPPTKGGVTTFMLNLMASQASAEFEFIPFTTSRPPKLNVTQNWGYGAIFRGGVRRVLAGIFITLWHLVFFPFALLNRSIEVVQIQASDYQVFWESALYAAMARLLGRPVVFRIGGAFDIFHDASPPVVKRLIAAALRIPNCVVVQSNYTREYVATLSSARKLIILPNWSRQGAGPPRPYIEINSQPLCLFIAGQEAERKGIRQVLDAARALTAQGSPARFHLIAVPETLAAEITAMRLGNISAMDGPLERERVLEFMTLADVFLLPSHGEGFPNSLMEAMAAGMACVVTPVGAMPEIVADGGALTVPVGSATALADAIARLATDGQLRRRLSEEARSIISSHYTAEKALLPLLNEYRLLLRDVPSP